MYPALPTPARFVVLSGPSGAGKSTLMRVFTGRNPDFVRCLSVTTRRPRGEERDQVDYHFVDQAAFDRQVAEGGFLEHATVFGQASYGTPRRFIEERLAAGGSVIKDMDVQGAAQIRRSFPTAIQVFVVPPAREDIEARLRGRGTEGEASVRRRLAEADAELARWRDYDYLLVNGDLEAAVRDLEAVVRAERLRIADR